MRQTFRILAVLTSLATGMAHANAAFAQTPSDLTLSDVPSLTPGGPVLTGDLADGAQDLWLFTVPEGPAQVYTLYMSGFAGTGGLGKILRITRNAAAEVTSREDVGGTAVGPLGPGGAAQSAPMILPPGEYVLGLAPYTGGEGSYEMALLVEDPVAIEIPQESGLQTPVGAGLWRVRGTGAQQCLPLGIDDLGGSVDLDILSHPDGNTQVELIDVDENGRDQRLLVGPAYQLYTLSALGAGPGRALCLRTPEGIDGVFRLTASALAADIVPEPDEDPARAHDLPRDGYLTGRIDTRGGRTDFDLFRLPPGDTPGVIEIEAAPGGSVEMELLSARGDVIKAATVTDLLAVEPLDAGTEIFVRISGERPQIYGIWHGDAPRPRPGEEVEPNDRPGYANLVAADQVIRGTLGPGDTDRFEIDLPGPAQLWRVQVDGPNIRRLTLFEADGEVLIQRDASGRGQIRASGIYMLPGPLMTALDGAGPYTIRAIPMGPRRPDSEVEPNVPARQLDWPARVVGMLDAADTDRFLLRVDGDERVRFTLTPPIGQTVNFSLNQDRTELARRSVTGPGKMLDHTMTLHAGDYVIELTSTRDGAGLDDYVLTVDAAETQWPTGRDLEPNRFPHQAATIAPDNILRGELHTAGDFDIFGIDDVQIGESIDFCDLDSPLSLAVIGPPPGLDTLRGQRITRDDGTVCRQYTATSPGRHFIKLTQANARTSQQLTTEYALTLTGTALPDPQPLSEPVPLTVTVVETPPVPRAFLTEMAQALPFTLRVTGAPETVAIPPKVTLRASAPGWSLDPAPQVVRAGDGWDVTGTLRAAQDLPARPVRMHLLVHSPGARGETRLDLLPDPAAPAVDPRRDWAVPDSMLGGVDVAAAAAGGRFVTLDGAPVEAKIDDAWPLDPLTDGLAIAINGFQTSADPEPRAWFTFDLAGEDPIPLAGLLLTPRVSPQAANTLRRFAIEASTDGDSFVRIYEGQLTAQPIEQAVVFDAPIPATHLRLIAIDSWSHTSTPASRIRLGEFKAVAVPGHLPPALRAANLADPALGGHVVRFSGRLLLDRSWDDVLLTPAGDRPLVLRRQEQAEAVVGFHHGRVARLGRIELDYALGYDGPAVRPAGVELSASTTGALGPWTPVTTWTFDPARADAPGVLALTFETPVDARNLRLRYILPDGYDPTPGLHLPDQMRLIAATPSAQRPSILGEWGEFSTASVYERENTRPVVVPPRAGGDSLQTAVPLPRAVLTPSSVQRGVHDDWFALDLTEDEAPRTLTLALQTDNRGGARAEVIGPAGDPLPLVRADPDTYQGDLDGTVVTALLDQPGRYYLRITEPRRAIIVAWDTSGSTNPYRQSLRRALQQIALLADPETDLIGFLPFGGDLLGEALLGDPELLQRLLSGYRGGDDSSNVEAALELAATRLAGQDGVRGVILMTDAAGNTTNTLWDQLEITRPLVAALAIPSTGAFAADPPRERDLMTDWAQMAGGFYRYISSQPDFADGFARATARMRAPKPYALWADLGAPAPIPPGRLQVLAAAQGGEGRTDGGPAVATGNLMILLDNSGSMLARIDGERRYVVAQRALADLVAAASQTNTAIGLRVFGVRPDTCETALLTPPEGTDPSAVLAAIADVRPQNLARTPIADALIAARGDLAGRPGPARVVVLTDGEETCDGDPAAAIAGLIEDGISTRIDIVGFEIDDAALSDTFAAWAALGQGAYVNARSAQALADALTQVAQARFVATPLTPGAGAPVAGVVGDAPVDLPAGRYALSIDGGPAREISVPPGDLLSVTLD